MTKFVFLNSDVVSFSDNSITKAIYLKLIVLILMRK